MRTLKTSEAALRPPAASMLHCMELTVRIGAKCKAQSYAHLRRLSATAGRCVNAHGGVLLSVQLCL